MTTLDEKLINVLHNWEYEQLITLEEAIAEIKAVIIELLPDTFDEYGIGKDAQQYLTDIKNKLQ